mgnify:CR=1 FL=1
MEIAINQKTQTLFVKREPGENRIGKESTFFYHLAKELESKKIFGSLHFIRKEMGKDGNMVSDGLFYTRSNDQSIMVYDEYCYTRAVEKEFNKGKTLELAYADFRTAEG